MKKSQRLLKKSKALVKPYALIIYSKMIEFRQTLFYKEQIKIVKQFFELVRPVSTELELIRIGPSGDGGYLLPNDLDDITACFSPGVGNFWEFEKYFAGKKIPVYMLDGSIEKLNADDENLQFESKYLRGYTSDKSYDLNTWVKYKDNNINGNLILQMDIEGSEYEVLEKVDEEILTRFRIMAIEFHNLSNIFQPKKSEQILNVIRKICRHFNVVHVHPNNGGGVIKVGRFEVPRVVEFTFLRKDRSPMLGFRQDFPHPLDAPNLIEIPDTSLPTCWTSPDDF